MLSCLAKAHYCRRHMCLQASCCPCRKEVKGHLNSLFRSGSQKSHCWLYVQLLLENSQNDFKTSGYPHCLLTAVVASVQPPACPVVCGLHSQAKKAAYKISGWRCRKSCSASAEAISVLLDQEVSRAMSVWKAKYQHWWTFWWKRDRGIHITSHTMSSKTRVVQK